MKKETLPTIGFALIMTAMVYLIVKMTIADVTLNLATWLLWLVTDSFILVAALAASKKDKSGPPWCALAFESGVIIIITVTIWKMISGDGQFSWGNTETLSAVCTLIALAIWRKTTVANFKLVAITVAMYIAMVPTFMDQWKDPTGQDPWFWLMCSIGAGLEFYAKPKSIAGAFLPGCAMIFNGLAAYLCFLQYT